MIEGMTYLASYTWSRILQGFLVVQLCWENGQLSMVVESLLLFGVWLLVEMTLAGFGKSCSMGVIVPYKKINMKIKSHFYEQLQHRTLIENNSDLCILILILCTCILSGIDFLHHLPLLERWSGVQLHKSFAPPLSGTPGRAVRVRKLETAYWLLHCVEAGWAGWQPEGFMPQGVGLLDFLSPALLPLYSLRLTGYLVKGKAGIFWY